MTSITALQNTKGVSSVISIKPKDIEKQIEFTCKDIKPDAIKIGMLHSSEIIKSVNKSLKKIGNKKIILDPVMVAKGGTRLINYSAIKTLKETLIKNVFLITPNIPEAEVLTNRKIRTIDDMINAGNVLLEHGVKNVLIKGGHRKSKYIIDVLVSKKEIKIFKNKKINTKNTHGTGCTLSNNNIFILENIKCG